MPSYKYFFSIKTSLEANPVGEIPGGFRVDLRYQTIPGSIFTAPERYIDDWIKGHCEDWAPSAPWNPDPKTWLRPPPPPALAPAGTIPQTWHAEGPANLTPPKLDQCSDEIKDSIIELWRAGALAKAAEAAATASAAAAAAARAAAAAAAAPAAAAAAAGAAAAAAAKVIAADAAAAYAKAAAEVAYLKLKVLRNVAVARQYLAPPTPSNTALLELRDARYLEWFGLDGQFMSGGDWVLVRDDAVVLFKGRGTIQADDGQETSERSLIDVVFGGVTDLRNRANDSLDDGVTEELFAEWRAGLDRTSVPVVLSVTFEAAGRTENWADEKYTKRAEHFWKYQRLVRGQFVAVGNVQIKKNAPYSPAERIEVDVYEVIP